jgi:hypothetical protein
VLVETSLDDPRWFDLVLGSPAATPFHHPAWARLLGDCYRFRSFVLAEESGGELVAGIPVLDVQLPFRRSRWVALPFTDELPVLARSHDEGSRMVADAATGRAAAGRPDLEIRAAVGAPAQEMPGHAWTHHLALEDPATLLANMDASHRRSVRRACAGPLRVRAATVERDVTSDFYRLHVRTRQRQGVPVQPRRYFALLWDRMIRPGLGFVLLADDGDRPVAGAVFLAWNGTVTYKYGASTPASWPERPNHFLLWEAIRRAGEGGAHTLDLGRTAVELEGLATYKRRWGATEERLVYSLVGGSRTRATERGVPRPAAAVLRRSPVVTRLTGELFYRYAA